MANPYSGLEIVCNGCGKLMKNLGEWSAVYPKTDQPKRVVQIARYMCDTCRIPSEHLKHGYPVNFGIIIGPYEEVK